MSIEQLDLYARQSDPVTSREAARLVDLNKRCAEVLTAARRFQQECLSTFTDGELADFMGEDRNIVARRRKDLVERGKVEPVYASERGDQLQRLGRRGRFELVWMVAA